MPLKNATFFAFLQQKLPFLHDFGRFLPSVALGMGFAYRRAVKIKRGNHVRF